MILGRHIAKATNVSEWLEIATEGITADGKERIAREIEAHHADAVQALREKGESGEAAESKALNDLGKPQDAAKKFRKEYFTEEDIKLLGELYKNSLRLLMGRRWFLFSLALSAALGFIPDFSSTRNRILLMAMWAIHAIIGPLIAYAVSRYSRLATVRSRLLYVEFLKIICTCGLTCFFATFGAAVGVLTGSGMYFWQLDRIRRKLGRSKQGDGETPLAA